MELLSFNGYETKVPVSEESVYLRIAMMYSKGVFACSSISELLTQWYHRESIPDRGYCLMLEGMSAAMNDEFNAMETYDKLKFLRKQKHKDKATLVLLQRGEQIMKTIKEIVLDILKDCINQSNLSVYLQIHEELGALVKSGGNPQIIMDKYGIVLFPLNEFTEVNMIESRIIKLFIDLILEFNQNLILDKRIEEFVPFSDFNSEEYKDKPYFVSEYLFEFPYLHNLNLNQLIHVRNEIKPEVKIFNDSFKEFGNNITSIPFENINNGVKTSFDRNIAPHLNTLRQKINENIYIQQQQNCYSENERIKVMLGVSSFENQIRLLEKQGIFTPFIVEGIIEKLAKNIDIKCCKPFIYHKYPV